MHHYWHHLVPRNTRGFTCSDAGLVCIRLHLQVKMVQTVLSAALLMSIKEQLYGATRAVLLAK